MFVTAFVRRLAVAALSVAAAACAATGGATPAAFPGAAGSRPAGHDARRSADTSPAIPTPSPAVDAILESARSLVGTPYRFGGASPAEGFDCSGLVTLRRQAPRHPAASHRRRSVRRWACRRSQQSRARGSRLLFDRRSRRHARRHRSGEQRHAALHPCARGRIVCARRAFRHALLGEPVGGRTTRVLAVTCLRPARPSGPCAREGSAASAAGACSDAPDCTHAD